MDLIVKRKNCSASFDRQSLHSYNGIPQEEVHATIDRVEVAADGFRHGKKAKRCFFLFLLIVALCLVGCAVKRHLRHQKGWWRHCGGRKGLWNSSHGKRVQPPTPPAPGVAGPDGQGLPVPPKFAPEFPHGFQKPAEWGRHGGRHGWQGRGGWGLRGHGHGHHGRGLSPQPAVDAPVDLPAQPTVGADQASQPATPATTTTPADATAAAPEASPTSEQTAEPVQAPIAGEASAGSVEGSGPVSMPAPLPMPPVSLPPVEANTDAAQQAMIIQHMIRMRRWKRWIMRMRIHRHRRRVFRFWAFVIGFPILICIMVKCHRRRVFKRVKKLLEIENRLFRAKYGCEWSVNWRVTELRLRRIYKPEHAAEVQLTAYPVQHVHAHVPAHHHPQQMVFHQQPAPQAPVNHSPIFTERHETVQQPQPPLRRGYQRVSLDDSVVGYN